MIKRRVSERALSTSNDGICGKVQPGQGRIAGRLIENKSTASKDCAEAIQKVEAMAAPKVKHADGAVKVGFAR